MFQPRTILPGNTPYRCFRCSCCEPVTRRVIDARCHTFRERATDQAPTHKNVHTVQLESIEGEYTVVGPTYLHRMSIRG